MENYAKFGWDDRVFNKEYEETVFRNKTKLRPEDLKEKLALDAGCGNGRYTYWAARYGAEVIGMDLGDGVDSAFSNTRKMPNVHIVQSDIFNLPFRKHTFDAIFSIGVLMHTGDAKKAVASLAERLKENGTMSVVLYGKGNPVYEWLDAAIRKKTIKMSVYDLLGLSKKLYLIARSLQYLRLLRIINRFVFLENHPHCIFDWYSAPIATHHSYREVKSWFDELDFTILKTDENQKSRFNSRWLKAHPSITLQAAKNR